jgi:hypothetical protein
MKTAEDRSRCDDAEALNHRARERGIHRFAAAAEIVSSVRAVPISYEVVSSLPIRARGIPETD